MAEAIHLLETVPEQNAAGAGTNNAWSETDSAKELSFDLSQQAVPISGIFTEAASAEELQLVLRLFFLPRDLAPRVVVFCSVGPRDGAEYVCARSAEILASQTKESVCLVDANLKDPKLHKRYDLDGEFHDVGLNSQAAKNTPERKGERDLWVLPASFLRESCPGLPPDQVRDSLSRLRKRFGYLLICAPSLDLAADGFLLGQMSDGIVLNLEARGTHRDAAVKTRQLLDAYNIPLLGAVINQRQERGSGSRDWKVLHRECSESL